MQGITLEELESLRKKAAGVCESCETGDHLLFVDHDHATGRFRGFLCDSCNKGIGFFKDDIRRLESAIQYLKIKGLAQC
jgi:hypothetical protein